MDFSINCKSIRDLVSLTILVFTAGNADIQPWLVEWLWKSYGFQFSLYLRGEKLEVKDFLLNEDFPIIGEVFFPRGKEVAVVLTPVLGDSPEWEEDMEQDWTEQLQAGEPEVIRGWEDFE